MSTDSRSSFRLRLALQTTFVAGVVIATTMVDVKEGTA